MVRLTAVAPQLAVPDVIEAANYYRDVLGFQISGTFGDPPVHAIVVRDEAHIFLGRSRTEAGASNRTLSPAGIDIYLWLEGLDEFAGEIGARGGEIIEGPVTRSYGIREIVVRDLNGFVLAFGEDTGGAE